MEKKIVEGNRLIAEFMKMQIGGGLGKLTVIHRGQYCSPKYHTSWDWLMPVVHKAWDTTTEDQQQFGGQELFELSLFADMKTIWQAVVSFIQWYNKQPKS